MIKAGIPEAGLWSECKSLCRSMSLTILSVSELEMSPGGVGDVCLEKSILNKEKRQEKKKGPDTSHSSKRPKIEGQRSNGGHKTQKKENNRISVKKKIFKHQTEITYF